MSESTKRLKEIKKRLEVTTPAPWRWNTRDTFGDDWPIGTIIDLGGGDHEGRQSNFIITTDRMVASQSNGSTAKDDAEFISNARQDIPWLVAKIERLEGACKEASGLLADMHDGPECKFNGGDGCLACLCQDVLDTGQ